MAFLNFMKSIFTFMKTHKKSLCTWSHKLLHGVYKEEEHLSVFVEIRVKHNNRAPLWLKTKIATQALTGWITRWRIVSWVMTLTRGVIIYDWETTWWGFKQKTFSRKLFCNLGFCKPLMTKPELHVTQMFRHAESLHVSGSLMKKASTDDKPFCNSCTWNEDPVRKVIWTTGKGEAFIEIGMYRK